jgi:hypothetical protein
MRRLKVSFAVVVVLFCCAAAAFAQQEKVIYTVTGEKYQGALHKRDAKFVELRIKGGIATIPVSAIKKMVDLVKEAKFQYLVVHDKDLADRLHQELRYGTDFTILVKDYSEDISLFKEGKTAFVDESYFAENVSRMAFKLNKGNYTGPIKVKDAWYIVKVLDKRDVERESEEPPKESPLPDSKTDEQTPEEPAPQEKSEKKTRVAVLPSKEDTREAKVGAMGSYVQELLVSDISKTTGFEAFAVQKAPKPDDKDAPDFVVSGQVATQEPVHAIQFLLKNIRGKELYTTERLTAVCGDDIDNLIAAIKAQAEALVREMKKPR